ncbi:hypothetical protein CK203_064856 [Vitis vinifera]|uniref:Uncharacterized protein n=1 Tax=Vitis vinifera TaxID=29760 RepID=A0A438FP92_VITVI|nr:hypothetical protein CK203_064856 [Vitis vinifera]
MFGDCNTYNSNSRNHPNFSWNHSHLSTSNLLKHFRKPRTLNNLWFANLNKVQEKGNFSSQPYQNSKGIHEVEAQKRESSMVKLDAVITLRSGKEVDPAHIQARA